MVSGGALVREGLRPCGTLVESATYIE
jgi:hypothetical protein